MRACVHVLVDIFVLFLTEERTAGTKQGMGCRYEPGATPRPLLLFSYGRTPHTSRPTPHTSHRPRYQQQHGHPSARRGWSVRSLTWLVARSWFDVILRRKIQDTLLCHRLLLYCCFSREFTAVTGTSLPCSCWQHTFFRFFRCWSSSSRFWRRKPVQGSSA